MQVALRRWRDIAELDHPETWVRRTCANMAAITFDIASGRLVMSGSLDGSQSALLTMDLVSGP